MNYKNQINGERLLHIAISRANASIVRLLIVSGARINVRDDMVQSAIADVRQDGVDLVDVILEAGFVR